MSALPTRDAGSLWAFAGIFSVSLLGLMAVGVVLPVLPVYVEGPLEGGEFTIGFVVGAFAFTGLAARPIAGYLADRRGRRQVAILGSTLSVIAGGLYFLPAGIPGLIASRLFLGAGEGMVFTAGAAWVVDLAPSDRRGRVIGLFGLSVWTGLSLGPPIGELLFQAGSYELVWAFATAVPIVGAMLAWRLPERFTPPPQPGRRTLIAREALLPGSALALKIAGYAALAAFIVLLLDERGIGHGAAVFTAFAAMVVLTRIVAGDLPDRIGPLRCAFGAALVEAVGLVVIALAHSLPVAIAGALVMGAAFSTLYPSLSLHVVNQVPARRRGVALGTFTAFFDVGMGLGSPLVGAAAAIGGYEAAFWVAAACAMGAAGVIAVLRKGSLGVAPAPAAAGSSPPP